MLCAPAVDEFAASGGRDEAPPRNAPSCRRRAGDSLVRVWCEMNARRGLFRLWIVFCVLVVISVSVASYNDVRDEFRVAGNLHAHMLPVACIDSALRGTAGTDYSFGGGFCWYRMKDFRRLYPEYSVIVKLADGAELHFPPGTSTDVVQRVVKQYQPKTQPLISEGLSDSALLDRLEAKVSLNPHPWRTIMGLAEGTVGVLLAVFVLGYALIWAGSGFHSRPD
jgi:hypothetical protein